jgi:hypothetical protein
MVVASVVLANGRHRWEDFEACSGKNVRAYLKNNLMHKELESNSGGRTPA